MRKISIIGGMYIENLEFLNEFEEKIFSTDYGDVVYYLKGNVVLIQRHGKEKLPPSKINYKANIKCIKELDCKYIFSFNSVGSLKRNIEPGTFLIPNDYIDFDPPTFYENNVQFVVPALSENLRDILIKILKKLRIKFKEGVYFNTKGPRFETKAEINLIKNYADVVGMTMAKEATLANEMNIEYISLCSVDNYANGIVKPLLSEEEIRINQKNSLNKIEKIIKEILRLKI